MTAFLRWAPAVIMGIGATLVYGLLAPQMEMQLEAPLTSVVPDTFQEMEGVDQVVSEAEAIVAGFDDYLFRVYSSPDDTTSSAWISLYVGYYESQTQGRTIHSPKNCLPGGGWEPLQSTEAEIIATDGTVATVNRYVLRRETEQALVLYWYQGRGRIQSNEYAVKLDLLRDAAFRRRTDEALVRIVVPFAGSEEEAFDLAHALASTVIPAVERALPN